MAKETREYIESQIEYYLETKAETIKEISGDNWLSYHRIGKLIKHCVHLELWEQVKMNFDSIEMKRREIGIAKRGEPEAKDFPAQLIESIEKTKDTEMALAIRHNSTVLERERARQWKEFVDGKFWDIKYLHEMYEREIRHENHRQKIT